VSSNGQGESSNGQGGRVISWDRARARLATLERMMAEAERPSRQRAEALLEARARQLARPLAEPAGPGAVTEVIVFSLARERYALDAALVREIVRFADFTPVPGAADFLVGVTNLRGEILPVFDLHRFFDLPSRGLTDQSRVVVLGHDRRELGVLADETHEVVSVRADEVRAPAPSIGAGSAGREYIRGFTADALVVLDGERLLRDPRLFIDHSEAINRPPRPE
jgi:purine-binding chemotaxis protein CheW